MELTDKFEKFFADFAAAAEVDDDAKIDQLEELEKSLLETATPEERYEHTIRESHFVTGASLEEIDCLAAELAKSTEVMDKTNIILGNKLEFNGLVLDRYSTVSVTVIKGGMNPPKFH